jgi:hypothetical protein
MIEVAKIYCDLDQVLTNFLGGARKVLGREFNDPIQFCGEDKWPIIGKMPQFWLDLDWMPNARLIWDHIKNKNSYILSAIPNVEIVPLCSIQKKQWCKRELDINADRVIVVVARRDKKNFATTNGISNLLIDDNSGNVRDWIDVGGLAIHHQTVPETIMQLHQFGL